MAGLGIVKKAKSELTKEELQQRFPAKAKTITDETIELINAANADPNFNGDEFLQTMYDYENVMYKNKASMKDYITALKFCAYLESEGDNYTEAYKRARANDEFVIARKDADTSSDQYKELTFAASRYRKTPMVRDILTQADMPLYLMFQGARYKAVKLLADEMIGAAYSKDRINAADKLLTHVKPPENAKIELDIGIAQDSIIDKYEAMINQLVQTQKQQIADGGNLKDIANVDIIAKHHREDYIEIEAEDE
jgi:hypothetical protein